MSAGDERTGIVGRGFHNFFPLLSSAIHLWTLIFAVPTIEVLPVDLDLRTVSSTFIPGNFTATWPNRGGVELVVDGEHAYVAGINGLQIFDISDLSSPKRVGHLEEPNVAPWDDLFGVVEDARSLQKRGTTLFVTDRFGLQTIDVSIPSSPQQLSTFSTFGETMGADVSGDYAVLVERHHWSGSSPEGAFGELHVLNWRTSSPTLEKVGSYRTNFSQPRSIEIAGNYAFVTDEISGMLIIDISDAKQPRVVTQLSGRQFTLASNRLYSSEGLVVDVSDPKNPRVEAGVEGSGTKLLFQCCGGPDSFAPSDQWLFIGRNRGLPPRIEPAIGSPDGRLDVYDLSEPVFPKIIASQRSTLEFGAFAVASEGNHVFVVEVDCGRDGGGGCRKIQIGNALLKVMDFTNPANPQRMGRIRSDGDFPRIAASGDYAFVTSRSMIEILDLGVNANPLFVGNYSTESLIADVQVEGSRLYALLGPKWENGVITESSVQILDISNPTSPRLTGTASEIGLYAEAMAVTERFIYLGTMGDMWPPQFKVFNVDEHGSSRVEGILDLRAPAVGIALFQSYAGVVDNSGLTIIDLKDPRRPNAVGTYDPGFASTDVAIFGEYALLTHSAGFDVIDLSDPQKPELVARVTTSDPVSEVGIDGDHAYIVIREGLSVFDISVPSKPHRVGGHTFAARWDFTFDPDFSYEPVGVNIAEHKIFARSRHAILILNKYQPLKFGKVLRQGATELQLSGPPGVSAWVQRSHELEEWENWKLVDFQNSVVELGDFDADSEVKSFYRMTVPSIRALISNK